MPAIRVVGITLILFLGAQATLAAEPLHWHSDVKSALAAARAQQKMLLVNLRSACSRCDLDEAFEKAAADPIFVHALDSFVLLRVTANTMESRDPLLQKLAQKPGAPLRMLFDASGQQLFVLPQKHTWNHVVEELLRFRAERALIRRSVERRFAGQIADAELDLGNALLNVHKGQNAADRLEKAAKAFRAQNDIASAQLAEVLAGCALWDISQKHRGRRMIEQVLKSPANDAVAADAHLAIASQSEAAATKQVYARDLNGKTTRRLETDYISLNKAVAAYRKAYALAPVGSVTLAQARLGLLRLDDQPLPPKSGAAAVAKSAAAIAPLTNDDALIRIVPPARRTIVGDADFYLQAKAGITRVDFYLDETKVGSASEQPFRVTIDLGRIPRARIVKAVALDRAGKAMGEAMVTVNDRADAFFVSIVNPAMTWISGATDVELDVSLPPERSVQRVDLQWNDKQVATLKAPPFRTKINVAEGEFGYLRAVVTLDDGTTAESTRIYNASGVSESVEVGAVTLIASVTSRKGEIVGGLQAKDFKIADEGKRVSPTLRSSDDEPVTIGVAIDSSSSMRGRQLYVMRAAAEFLGRALRPQDVAFLLSFDHGARIVHGRTSDGQRLRSLVFDMVPQGGTSIFDGVTFALQQFQGISGKKALLVLSDGREGTSSGSAKECERLARAVGVPIYVVSPPEESARSRPPHALMHIAEVTGGTMFTGEPEETFPAMFDRLAAEMRGQYVLSFTRPTGIKAGAWRNIRVDVERRDANVRTIQGYWAN
ncbi:MAG TPA: VWA domain-containing protein [Thermoanaerobaculia bacterium]|jgi:VWFA-related protein|nr:VWA domain-containing protein [Thermoanaerobaculia bacterium]